MAKQFLIVLIFLFVFPEILHAKFSNYFEDKTLRIDYFRCGKVGEEAFFFDKLIEEPYWAGSKINLIDTKGYGSNFLEVRTADSNKLIYSRGFSTLFGEWQTTPEAITTARCYPESVLIPFPKGKVVVAITSRSKDGKFEKKFEHTIDPENYFIRKEKKNHPVFDVVKSGKPSEKVDIVLLPEGYTEGQKALFEQDCRFFADELFRFAPFSENKDKFNIRGVWVASENEGPDIPGDDVWNTTCLNGSFYTFDSERYLMVENFHGIRDIAGNAPYDYVYILTNTEKYGGGGIYNFYGISAAHHADKTGKIYIHEFGHLFAGLGDEYVGGVEFSEFYPPHLEPWEPNLTTLVDFDLKWKSMLPVGAKIPTPESEWEKETLGVYEGAGYVTKGVYRPWVNCLMNNLHTIDQFCPVCNKAIQEMIDFHCK